MYLADLLNSRGFFQRCASWMEENEFADDFSLLLNRATSAVIGILRLEELQKQCVHEFSQFEDQLVDCDERIVFNSRSMVALQNEISPLLSALRIMQDSVNGLVRKKTRLEIPRSISDTMKNLDKYGLPADLRTAYLDYWDKGGSDLREYRILDQHYAGLVEHVFLQLKPTRKVLLLFPDDPTIHAKDKLTFEREICGISLLRIGFDDLHEFIENVAAYFGYEPKPLNQGVGMSQLGDLRPFRKRTLAFLHESSIKPEEDGSLRMHISGIRFGQLPDGRLEVQRMFLSDEKLAELNG